MREADRLIEWLASRQYGVVARWQLLRLGVGADAIRTRLRNGRLVRIERGVHAVGRAPLTRRGSELAAVLGCGEGALLGRRAAAALWEIASPVTEIEVLVARSNLPVGRTFRSYRTTNLPAADIRRRRNIPVTSPTRTLLDLAAIPSFDDLELAVAIARRRGLVGRRALAERVAAERGRPGIGRLRAILGQAGGARFTRSGLERRFLARLREAGIETPLTGEPVGDYEADFLWPAERLIVETDGFETHGLESAFHADRARDADLKSRGYEVLRVTWPQIDGDALRVIARLAATLAIRRERSRR